MSVIDFSSLNVMIFSLVKLTRAEHKGAFYMPFYKRISKKTLKLAIIILLAAAVLLSVVFTLSLIHI